MAGGNKGQPERLQGEVARLIPIGGSGQLESNATSAFLATLTVVDEFAQAITNMIGIHLGARAKIRCFTEVKFKVKVDKELAGLRPDGLIEITTGKRTQNFLVEAKAKKELLTRDQIDKYLRMARELGMDGLITISNQFAPTPLTHPVDVPKGLTRSVSLYHWSWSAIITEAIIIARHKGVSDPEQSYIMNELIRFLEHEKSGVVGFDSMGPHWKDLARRAFAGDALPASSEFVVESVAAWHQALRYVTLVMSRRLGSPVIVKLGRKHLSEPDSRIKEDVAELGQRRRMVAAIQIPDAADSMRIEVDFTRRAIVASMNLKAPQQFKQGRAYETWIKKQLAKCEDAAVRVQANWPGRTPPTSETVALLGTDDSKLIPNGTKSLPTSFEISKMIDLGGRIGQTKTFVDDLSDAVAGFYRHVGQHLVAWQPPAPKVKETEEDHQDTDGRENIEPDETLIEIVHE